MTLTMDVTTLRRCTACGSLVEAGVNFCPECGTRQIDEEPRPAPVIEVVPDADSPPGPTLAILVAFGISALLLALAIGVVVGGVGTSLGALGDGGDGDADAADAMDEYAPIADDWSDKHEHVADEAQGDDPNGLALAANDAAAWIEINEPDLRAAADGADGASAPLYDQLMGAFDRRSEVLVAIEQTAEAGGTGDGAAADEMAELSVLDQQAAATTCEIADVMLSEGDDPSDHMSSSMLAACA
jgi:zinc-ribbon domain